MVFIVIFYRAFGRVRSDVDGIRLRWGCRLTSQWHRRAFNLIAIVPKLAACANCANGGTRFTSGLDSNRNGVLDASEVTSTTYNCNPPPASMLTWLDAPVDTTSTPNRGDLASGAARVTITLPANPSVGDVISVSGIGAGGFTIAPNTGQHVLVRGLPVRLTPRLGPTLFIGVASSADGVHLVAVESPGNIFTSSDSGVTWSPRDTARSWYAVAISSDGSKMLASDGTIYASSDYGVTWAASNAPNKAWEVALAGDGTRAVAYDGNIAGSYVSDATGLLWNPVSSPSSVSGIASATLSADGTRIYATASSANFPAPMIGVYSSPDGRRHMDQLLYVVGGASNRIAASADGSRLFFVVSGVHVSIQAHRGLSAPQMCIVPSRCRRMDRRLAWAGWLVWA